MKLSGSKLIMYLPLLLIIVGVGSMIGGATMDHPGYEVNYLTEYNEQYGEDRQQDNYAIDIITNNSDDDVEPSDIHRTYNISQFNNETQDKLRDIRGTDNSTIIYDSNLTQGRIIIHMDNQSYVYESSRDGVTPQQLGIFGVFMILIGLGLQISLQSAKEKIPDDVEKSDDGEWIYYPK